MVFLDRPKKILIASSSGVVLLLGFLALKARAGEVPTPEQQQELLTLSDTLKTNSADLGELAQNLGGTEGEQVDAIRAYIDDLSQQLDAGQLPSEAEVKQVNEKLGGLTQQLDSPKTPETQAGASQETSADKPEQSSSAGTSQKSFSTGEDESSAKGAIRASGSGTTGKSSGSDTPTSAAQKRDPSASQPKTSPSASATNSKSPEQNKDNQVAAKAATAAAGSQAVAQMDENIGEVEAVLEQLPTVVEEIGGIFANFKDYLDSEVETFQNNDAELLSSLENGQLAYQENQNQISEQQNTIVTQFQSFFAKIDSSSTRLEQSFQSIIETEQTLSVQVESEQESTNQAIDDYVIYTNSFLEDIDSKDNSIFDEEEELDNHFDGLVESMENMQQELEEQIGNSEIFGDSLIKSLEQYQTDLAQSLADFRKSLTQEQLTVIGSGFSGLSNQLRQEAKSLETNIKQGAGTVQDKINELVNRLDQYFNDNVYQSLDIKYELAYQSINEILGQLTSNENRIKNHEQSCECLIDVTENIKESSEIIAKIKQELSSYSL